MAHPRHYSSFSRKLTSSAMVALALALGVAVAAGQQDRASLAAAPPAATTGPAVASSTPLDKLVEEATRNNPRILAAQRAWQAAAQVPSQVSTLPDPQFVVQDVSAGAPIPGWDYNSVEMTFVGFGVSQSLPYPGKLRLRGEMARSEAASLADRVDSVRRSVVEQVKAAYYRLSYVQKTLGILSQDQALIGQVEKIAEARYRVGQGNQQDVLKAQLEQTKLLQDVAESQQQHGVLEARLKQLLNRPPDSGDIVAAALTETPLPYTSDNLLSRVRAGNPDVGTQQQMVRRRNVGVQVARKDYYPDFDVQYMWERTGTPFPDRYSLSFGIRIPIYRSRRQDRELAQAAEQLNQARREYDDQVQQAYFEVRDQYLAADTSDKVLKIYREGLIPQATATFQAGMAGYASGQEDFETLLNSFLDVLNLDTEYWRTLADHETALARLEQLTGVTLP